MLRFEDVQDGPNLHRADAGQRSIDFDLCYMWRRRRSCVCLQQQMECFQPKTEDCKGSAPLAARCQVLRSKVSRCLLFLLCAGPRPSNSVPNRERTADHLQLSSCIEREHEAYLRSFVSPVLISEPLQKATNQPMKSLSTLLRSENTVLFSYLTSKNIDSSSQQPAADIFCRRT